MKVGFISKRAFSTIPPGSFLPQSEVTERVIAVVESIKSCKNRVKPDSYFVKDLGLDSMQRKILNKLLADEFCVRVDSNTSDNFISIETAVKYFAAHPKSR